MSPGLFALRFRYSPISRLARDLRYSQAARLALDLRNLRPAESLPMFGTLSMLGSLWTSVLSRQRLTH